MGLEQYFASATNTLVALATSYGMRVIGAVVILAVPREAAGTSGNPAGR